MARSHDMTSGSIWRSLLGFSIPIMISNLVQSTYNAVDMLFVGRFTGTESLAAVSVCGPIMHVMIITLSGMSAGVLVVISGLLGAGDIKQAQDAAHTSVALYALMAAVMTVLGLLFVPQILRLVQTPAAAMPEAKRYLYTVFAGTVFTFGYNLIGALQRGLQEQVAAGVQARMGVRVQPFRALEERERLRLVQKRLAAGKGDAAHQRIFLHTPEQVLHCHIRARAERPAFRVVAALAPARAALRKNSCAQARAVYNGILHDACDIDRLLYQNKSAP